MPNVTVTRMLVASGAALALGVGLVAAPSPAVADRAVPLSSPTFTETGDEMVTFKGHVYFAANDGVNGNELWRTDGTAAGTTMVADLDGQGDALHTKPTRLTVAGDRLFFNTNSFKDVFAYSGSGTPTKVTYAAGGIGGHLVGSVNDRALIRGRLSGTLTPTVWAVPPGSTQASNVSGTVQVSANEPAPAVTMNGWAYFQGGNNSGTPNHGAEVYRTNGSSTELVKNVAPDTNPANPTGSDPHSFTAAGDLVYFTAHTPLDGWELWRTDGTSAGTSMVKAHHPGAASTSFGSFAHHGGQFYYTANINAGHQLWRTNGTSAGTQRVGDVVGAFGLTSIGSRLVFFTNQKVYATDGTTAGTKVIATPHSTGTPKAYPTVVGGRVYFRAGTPQGNVVWRSDGTAGGTFPLSAGAYDPNPAAPGDPSIGPIGVVGSKVVFTSRIPSGAGRRLTAIDRTKADLVRRATVAPRISGTPKPGTSLTLSAGTWSPEPQAYSYQWFQDGKPIRNATSTSLYLWESMLGSKLHATVTAGGIGAPSVTARTATVTVTKTGAKAGKTLALTKKPKIKGKPRVGKKLKAVKPKFKQSGVKLRYRWLADGVRIAKATKKKLKLKKAHKGKKVAVRVTAKKPGYAKRVVTSKATKPVR